LPIHDTPSEEMPKKPLRRDYLEDSDDDDEDYSILRRARNAFVVAKDPKHRRSLVLSYLPGGCRLPLLCLRG
jgi:hypothetical protein